MDRGLFREEELAADAGVMVRGTEVFVTRRANEGFLERNLGRTSLVYEGAGEALRAGRGTVVDVMLVWYMLPAVYWPIEREGIVWWSCGRSVCEGRNQRSTIRK